MSLPLQAWVTIAVLLALGEAVTGGWLVMPWAIGAAVAAVLEALHVDSGFQWIAFVGVSCVLFIAIQRLRAPKE